MSMVPKFTFNDVVKHPVAVFLVTLMLSTSTIYITLTNSYEARIKAAESREKDAKADRDGILKELIQQLKVNNQKDNQIEILTKKDSITKAKIIQPLIEK